MAASDPRYVRKEDVTPEAYAREKDIFLAQAVASGKPQHIAEKMVTGKMEKFYEEVCLLEQPFIKDQTISIGQLIATKIGKLGENIAVRRFARFKVGDAGETIAIIDSGLDYTLPEFGGCFGAGCKVRSGFDLVGDAYNATPGPAFDSTPHPDGDPLPCDPDAADRAEVLGAGTSDAAHGTHVAGIAAADGRGHVDDGQVVGVAPGAKLLAYRVFGCNGGTDSDVLIHAMELALADHANVVNMSIGAAFNNWPQYPTAVAADNLVDAGVTVVTS